VNTVHGLRAQPHDPDAKPTVGYGLERLATARPHAELLRNPEDHRVLRPRRVPDARLRHLLYGADLTRFKPTVQLAARRGLRDELGIDLCGYRGGVNHGENVLPVPALDLDALGPTIGTPARREAIGAASQETGLASSDGRRRVAITRAVYARRLRRRASRLPTAARDPNSPTRRGP
jgi:hypothetical protein